MLYAVIETGAPCPVLYPESVSPSVVSDSVTPKTVAQKAPLFMGFSRPEYWSELPFPSPEDLPDPGIEPESPELQADSSPSELPVLHSAAAAAAKSLQLCPTLCDPIDGSSPGSSIMEFSLQYENGVGCHFLLQCMHAC